MYNDSVENLLLRHYGQNGPTPANLEHRLLNAVRQDTLSQQDPATLRVLRHPMNRRRAMKIVAVGSGGLGLIAGTLETLFAQDPIQSILS